MVNIAEQRLWIAVHLLYPNSSQASDVYEAILATLPKRNAVNYQKEIFLKLENFFLKNAAVRSGSPFNTFENYELTSWNILYQKSMKKHLLVILGLIIFDLKLSEVASLLKISEQKARFLVNQAFKKLTLSAEKNNVTETKFKFKKIEDKKVSYFYTAENLVEYALELLSPKDKKSVDEGLAEYPQLLSMQNKYSEIIQELRQIVSAEVGPVRPDLKIEPLKIKKHSAPSKFKFGKGSFIATTLAACFFGFVLIRPVTFKFFPAKLGGDSVKMLEVNSQPYLTENDVGNESGPAVNLNEMPVSETNRRSEEVSKVAASNKATGTFAKQIELPVAPVESAPTKQGGLYRASIQVSDVDALTARITDRLVALGGRKAGEVELGWKKTAKVSYYHLILPTENVEEAKMFLSKFGQLNIQFENHPRLMSNGSKRMILEVRESE